MTNDTTAGDLKAPVTAEDHVQGPETAPVTLLEYAGASS